MATNSTISSLGVGAGLDLNTMLSKLMAAEQQPLVAVSTKINTANTKISAFGKLQSALSTLQTAAQTFSSPSKLSAYTASSSDETVLTGSTSFSASAGTYSIEVTQLAKAQKDFSQTYASSTSFGAGTLNFTIGGTAQTGITIDASSTIQDIRTAINDAQIGITASVISTGSSDRLVLSGTQGSSGAFSLSVSGSTDANLQALATFDRTTAGLLWSDATDAAAKIDGVAVTSSSNTLTSSLNGVTLNLLKLGTSTLSVKSDPTAMSTSVKAFVDAYNTVNSYIKSNNAYNSTTKTAQPLNGESTVRSIQSLLATTRTSTPSALSSATFKTLSEIGVSVASDGSMSLDSTKLNTAMSKSTQSVKATLAAYGAAFDTSLTTILKTSGLMKSRLDGLNSAVGLYNKQADAIQLRLNAVEKRYRAQFTALDTTMGSLQTTSSYLTQQLARL